MKTPPAARAGLGAVDQSRYAAANTAPSTSTMNHHGGRLMGLRTYRP